MEYISLILFALSDPLRLRSLALLAASGELCACELTPALQVSQPTVSKHMATLREAGLVRDRRDAQWVLYSLSPDLPAWARDAVDAALRGARETSAHLDDLQRLALARRPPRQRSA